jgi:hypothetical protein
MRKMVLLLIMKSGKLRKSKNIRRKEGRKEEIKHLMSCQSNIALNYL